MAYGRRCEEWDRTSLLACLIHNGSPNATELVGPDHYHPLRASEAPAGPERVSISIADFATITGGTLEAIR